MEVGRDAAALFVQPDAAAMLAVVTRPLMREAPAGEKLSQKLSHPTAGTA